MSIIGMGTRPKSEMLNSAQNRIKRILPLKKIAIRDLIKFVHDAIIQFINYVHKQTHGHHDFGTWQITTHVFKYLFLIIED